MLFNSYQFIFIFLPVTLIGFFIISSRGNQRTAIAWLVGASLFFYGWWNPTYLGLIIGSILFNYATGILLNNHNSKRVSTWLLAFGVAVNLSLLGFFKYANFFLEEMNLALTSHQIILPLAISFFTFQQIAYLVDTYKGKTRENDFLRYCLFVTFFPQLIAGPIVHHKEMLPQFAKDKIYSLGYKNIAIGLTIFSIGLFKKVIIADTIAAYATPVFNVAESGTVLTFFEAWCGAFSYTFQLYFDFSGYSDMAIGLARLFGIRLPLNFHSPYKANNIIEFWRRWHITLSRFLKDYLYIPMGGNRKGVPKRYIYLMITMTLGGLWHGAGWTFVAWGALHGIYIIANHIYHALLRSLGLDGFSRLWLNALARVITLFAVVVGWVFFRAESFSGATAILSSMSGLNGISFDEVFTHSLANWTLGVPLIIILLLVVWFAPNTQQIMIRYKPAFEIYRGEIKPWRGGTFEWRPTFISAVVTAAILCFAIMHLLKHSEFIYFNF